MESHECHSLNRYVNETNKPFNQCRGSSESRNAFIETTGDERRGSKKALELSVGESGSESCDSDYRNTLLGLLLNGWTASEGPFFWHASNFKILRRSQKIACKNRAEILEITALLIFLENVFVSIILCEQSNHYQLEPNWNSPIINFKGKFCNRSRLCSCRKTPCRKRKNVKPITFGASCQNFWFVCYSNSSVICW